MTIIAEDTKKIEAEVMAEIRSALRLSESRSSTIAMPKVSTSPLESSTTETDEDEDESSCGEDRKTRVKVKNGLPTRSSGASLDGSGIHDSFVERLSASYSWSIGGSSTGTSDSSYPKFYIGTVSEESEEYSILSHVSDLGADDMSHSELLDVVKRLYKELKKADEALSAERKRRHSREKNLIKLAKELGRRKNVSTKQLNKNDEMQQMISMLLSEKALLEKKVETQKQATEEVRVSFQKKVDQEIKEIAQKYERMLAEHDERIIEINRMHAKQCEQLCREVVEANQEVMRLQKVLTDMTRGAYPVDRTFVSTIPREDIPGSSPASTKSIRSRRAGIYLTLLLLFATIFIVYRLHSFRVTMEVVEYFDSFDEPFNLDVDNLSQISVSQDEEAFQDSDIEVKNDQQPVENDSFQETTKQIPLQETKQVPSLEEVMSTIDLRGVFFDSSLPFRWFSSKVAALKTKSSEAQAHD